MSSAILQNKTRKHRISWAFHTKLSSLDFTSNGQLTLLLLQLRLRRHSAVFEIGDDIDFRQFQLNRAGLSLACMCVCAAVVLLRGTSEERRERERTWTRKKKIMRTQQMSCTHGLAQGISINVVDEGRKRKKGGRCIISRGARWDLISQCLSSERASLVEWLSPRALGLGRWTLHLATIRSGRSMTVFPNFNISLPNNFKAPPSFLSLPPQATLTYPTMHPHLHTEEVQKSAPSPPPPLHPSSTYHLTPTLQTAPRSSPSSNNATNAVSSGS